MQKKKKKPQALNPAQALAAMRHKSLSPERRKEIATQAARTRWSKKKRSKETQPHAN